jgi:hypothetical protein
MRLAHRTLAGRKEKREKRFCRSGGQKKKCRYQKYGSESQFTSHFASSIFQSSFYFGGDASPLLLDGNVCRKTRIRFLESGDVLVAALFDYTDLHG